MPYSTGCRYGDVVSTCCGVGGAAIRIELDAGSVIGIDVEEPALERATAAARAAGLAGRIRFELVSPGPIPHESVDIAFCKDVICHLADKGPLFSEVGRVLRRGGTFAFGDWTRGSAADACIA